VAESPSSSEAQGRSKRIFAGAFGRRFVLALLVLVAMVVAEAVFLNRSPGVDWRIRLFAAVICVYALVVLFYLLYWWFMAKRRGRAEPEVSPFTDPLTGLPNMDGLMIELGKERYAEHSGNRAAHLIYLMLINLAELNNEYGRRVGDAVLKELPAALKRKLREGWTAGRIGGSEFLFIAPMATDDEVMDVAESLRTAVQGFSLDIGELGKAAGLRARVSHAQYQPDWGSFQDALSLLRGGSQTVAFVGRETAPGCFHIPHVTLAAFAAKSWDGLDKGERLEFLRWKDSPDKEFTGKMAEDILMLLDLHVGRAKIDFITNTPLVGEIGTPERSAPEMLGQQLAEQAGISFRKVFGQMAAVAASGGHVEPALDAVVDSGSSVLLVQDIVTTGSLLRRSVRRLSSAGCHVLVLAWATRPASGVTSQDEQVS
jgi:diguanylate cyclase (GGDEF)-like protein